MAKYFSKISEVEKEYGKIEKKSDNKYQLFVFNHMLIKYRKYDFVLFFNHYYQWLELIDQQNDTVVKTYFLKNKRETVLWMQLKTFDNQCFDTTLKGYKTIIKTREKLNKIVGENGHKLLSSYILHSKDILIDFNCSHPAHWINPDNYIQGHNKCCYCTHERTLKFQDDVYTLRPDLLPYFINEQDSIGLPIQSNKRMMFKCPKCGNKKSYTIASLQRVGFNCNICNDGKSYPERFMYNILNAMNEEFETEKIFDWCQYNIDGKKYYGRYDIVLPLRNIIIEMDGRMHYIETDFGQLDLIQKKDYYKEKLAIENNYSIYRVNCNYHNLTDDRFQYVKNSIIQTFTNVFDLSNINWEEINIKSQESNMIQACNLWDQGLYICDIRKQLHLSETTLVDYLKRGASLGICSYTKEKSIQRASILRVENRRKNGTY